MPDSVSQIGETIRQAREDAGVTQSDLAAAIGRDVQTISRWERGERGPKAKDVERVMAYLRARSGLGENVPRGTMRVSEPSPLEVPSWLKLRIEDAVLELARAGASNEQGRYIREVLASDATLRFVLRNDDGTTRRATQQEDRIRDLIEGLHAWIERSALSRPESVGEIEPDLPADANREPLRPLARKGAQASESGSAQGKKR